MKNHTGEPKSSEIMFKNFKLPILQVSKPEFCHKVLQDFKKCIEENKQAYKDNNEPKAKQIMKKLKLASLIKGDRQSLSTIPVSQRYYPYRGVSRVVQTDFRKLGLKKKSVDFVRYKSQENDKFLVSKASMHINLRGQNKINYDFKSHLPTPRKNKIHKRSSTEGIYNFTPFSQRKSNKHRKTIKTERIEPYEQIDAFLTGTNMEMDYRAPNEQSKKEQPKLKPIMKSKFRNKLELMKQNQFNNELLNVSLRGWTQYGAKKQGIFNPYQNNEEI